MGASTRPGDEEILIRAWEQLETPRPSLLLAPRHLHRIEEIVDVSKPHRVGLRSNGLSREDDVWLLDRHGELAGLMRTAHVVVVGGTFDENIGGHSPSEAAAGGAHIVHGPHTSANPTAWRNLNTTEVDSIESLHRTMMELISTDRPVLKSSPVDVSSIINALPKPVPIPETNQYRMLWPMVPIWNSMSAIARLFQRTMPERNCVVVGGLVNGGAGRTPAVAWLADHLENVQVISAGYRRMGPGTDIRYGHPDHTPEKDLGDELEMIRRRGVAVTSSPNRIDAIDRCPPNQIPIIDGGMGDPRLRNGFRIACIDGQTPHGRGPFPVGRRRLPWSILNKVNAIWISNPPTENAIDSLPKGVVLVRSSMRAVGWIHKGTHYPLDAVQGTVDVVVGIASPERFVCTLIDLNLSIRSLRVVGDHEPLHDVPANTVLTEKDAARLPLDADVWALQMELDVDGGDQLLKHIEEYCQ